MTDRGDLQAEQELRPDVATYRRFLGTPDRVLLPFALSLVAGVVGRASSRTDLLWIGVLLAASVLVALAGVAGMLLTSRVRLGDGRVEYTRWWVRRTVIDLDQVTGLLATTTVTMSSRRVVLLVLREDDGGPHIRLNGTYWPRADLEAIARYAGVDAPAETLTLRQVEKRAPGTMRFRDLHPWVTGFGLAVAVVALIAFGVIAWFKHEGLPPWDRTPPRAVSSATVAAQDQVAGDLAAALGGPWQPGDVRLLGCEDDEQYDGWMRWVGVDRDGPGTTGRDTQVATALQVLEEGGYGVVGRPYEDDDAVLVSAVQLDADGHSTFGDGSTVEVYLYPYRATIKVHGPCEVPPH